MKQPIYYARGREDGSPFMMVPMNNPDKNIMENLYEALHYSELYAKRIKSEEGKKAYENSLRGLPCFLDSSGRLESIFRKGEVDALKRQGKQILELGRLEDTLTGLDIEINQELATKLQEYFERHPSEGFNLN